MRGHPMQSRSRKTSEASDLLRWGVGVCALLSVAVSASGQALPAPVIDPRSTEICMNSRISYHGGWSGTASDQMLGDVLHATAQAPVTATPLVIYAATPQNVYLYDAATHSLILHKAGDQRSDVTAAFEVGVAAGNMVDAGAAMHLAQLESIALWTGTANQLASCPRASATTYANSHWSPAEPIDIAISFGKRSVPGFTTTLVAISSDGTLPNPHTDGTVFMDAALDALAYGSTFGEEDLSPEEVSQLLWAAYGCSNHMASGKGGLVCSSAVANYYLTRRIYSIGPAGVYRFHNRRPPGTDMATRDHRIEPVQAGDARPALRLAVPRLPDAPHYVIICVGSTGAWPELEVGFAAVGAVLQATTSGLQGYVTTDLSAGEQAAIRGATGIPSGDTPIAVVSLGSPETGSHIPDTGREQPGLRMSVDEKITFGGRVAIRYELSADAMVELSVYDCLGHEVATIVREQQERGSHTAMWDCRSNRGHPALSGVYFCRLKAGQSASGERILVLR